MVICPISADVLAEISSKVTYSCNTAFGGITAVRFYKQGCDLTKIDITENTKSYSDTNQNGLLFKIDFNDNDGFSNYSEEKTASLDGKVQCTQTLSLEVPKAANAEKINTFSNPNLKFTAIVETKAGNNIVIGKTFGVSLQSSNVSSGAQRSDKDAIQLTFVAEEVNLCELLSQKS